MTFVEGERKRQLAARERAAITCSCNRSRNRRRLERQRRPSEFPVNENARDLTDRRSAGGLRKLEGPEPDAFGFFAEGFFDRVVERSARRIARGNERLFLLEKSPLTRDQLLRNEPRRCVSEQPLFFAQSQIHEPLTARRCRRFLLGKVPAESHGAESRRRPPRSFAAERSGRRARSRAPS